jgi:hypothetical protein
VGDWEATVKIMGSESKASASYKMGLGGYHLFLDFHGEFGGQKFEGKGQTGYDPLKKKYVSTWADSMSPFLLIMEGNFDKDGKRYTESGQGLNMEGKPTTMKSVHEFKDDDTLIFTMYNVNDGKDQEILSITYKRKK